MTDKKLHHGRSGLWLQLTTLVVTWCAAHSTLALQQDIPASQDTLVEHLEQVLAAVDITIVSQAATDRFALIYAQAETGPHVTVTLRQIPASDVQTKARTDVSILADSPTDSLLEATLMRQLNESLSAGK